MGLVRFAALDFTADAQPASNHGWPVRAYVSRWSDGPCHALKADAPCWPLFAAPR
jgi:hypothetical protein